jgi:hypothetical protein
VAEGHCCCAALTIEGQCAFIVYKIASAKAATV